MKLPKILQTISAKLKSKNAKAIIVGGSVRDHFLNLPIKDYDIEVYGLSSIEKLEDILKEYGHVKLVGKSFGVLKFVYRGEEYDFAFPRREKKVAAGHKGFKVVSDGFMNFKEAAKRRDFTINAMGYDIQKKEFIYPFNGMKDLKKGVIRHIDDKTFVEDPLRVYRGVQFCARFGYEMADETKELCKLVVKQGELEELPKERVFDEMKKLLLKSKKPSIGFELLKELGVLVYFPEISNDWKKLDRIAVYKNLAIILAVLSLHLNNEEIDSFLSRLSDEVKLIKSVKALVSAYQYMLHHKLDDTEIRRLSTKVNIQELSILAENEELLKEAKKLGVDRHPPVHLLQGRDLISLGYKPSEEFSKILDRVYEMQISGEIKDKKEAIEYVKDGLWR